MADSSTKPTTGPAPLTGPEAIQLNVGYFKTMPGILKIVELILGIICMACASPAWNRSTHFFLFAAVVGFIGTVLWSFVYLLSLRSALNLHINWILSELLFTVMVVILYLVAFIVIFVGSPFGSYIAAGIFAVFTTIVYAYASYLLYLENKGDVPALSPA